MSKSYYFNTGIEGKDTIQARLDYNKNNGGYAVWFQVGDRESYGFAWHVDADYFRFYRKPQARLLIPCGRRSAKKEQEAAQMLEQNALVYAQEFAAAAEALGAPKMTVTAAA